MAWRLTALADDGKEMSSDSVGNFHGKLMEKEETSVLPLCPMDLGLQNMVFKFFPLVWQHYK